jgi:hypothetical protein
MDGKEAKAGMQNCTSCPLTSCPLKRPYACHPTKTSRVPEMHMQTGFLAQLAERGPTQLA